MDQSTTTQLPIEPPIAPPEKIEPSTTLKTPPTLLVKLWNIFYKLTLFSGLLAVMYYFFLQPMKVTGQNPIAPFTLNQQIFSERVSYLFREPRVGDAVIFIAPAATDAGPGDIINYFGIITKIENTNNIQVFQIVSSEAQTNPWEVSRDKITAHIYSPLVSASHLEKIISEEVNPSSPPDPTANWKTFSNEKYAFSMEYPSELSLSENNVTDPHVVEIRDDNKALVVALQIQESAQRIPIGPGGANDYVEGAVDLNSMSWQSFYTPKAEFQLRQERSGYQYVFRFYGQENINELQKQILSTFKFTNEAPNDQGITTITTDKLPQAEFPSVSISYPKSWVLKQETDHEGTLDLELSKQGYVIKLWQAPSGGAVCLFDDSPQFEGPSGDFRSVKYTEIQMAGNTFRMFKLPSRVNLYSLCEKSNDGLYQSSSIGDLTVAEPSVPIDAIFKEVITILKSIKLN